jgi:hypothetical protein
VKLSPSAATGPADASERPSISTASQQTPAASLRANNVNDPGLGKLRQALTQHEADPAMIDKITNALEP